MWKIAGLLVKPSFCPQFRCRIGSPGTDERNTVLVDAHKKLIREFLESDRTQKAGLSKLQRDRNCKSTSRNVNSY